MYTLYNITIEESLVDIVQALLSQEIEMDGVSYDNNGFQFYVKDEIDNSKIYMELEKLKTINFKQKKMNEIQLSNEEVAYLIDRLSVINDRFYQLEIKAENVDEVAELQISEDLKKQKQSEHNMVLCLLAKLAAKI